MLWSRRTIFLRWSWRAGHLGVIIASDVGRD
jgi:hypothetical protein